jgi:curved DNA-binding protein CbpA
MAEISQARPGLSHYEVLKVDRHASAEEIRAAYLAAALQLHPDKASRGPIEGPGTADAEFLRVQKAWEVRLSSISNQVFLK